MPRLLLVSNSTNHGQGYLDHCIAEMDDFLGARRRLLFVPFALKDREAYGAKARSMGLTDRVRFVGHWPAANLDELLVEADILTAPRIKGINTQDVALQEGMGAIADRTQEHLGSSDRAILAMRNLLSAAVRAVERGERPRGIDPAGYRSVRPHDGVVPAGTDWRSAFADAMAAKW